MPTRQGGSFSKPGTSGRNDASIAGASPPGRRHQCHALIGGKDDWDIAQMFAAVRPVGAQTRTCPSRAGYLPSSPRRLHKRPKPEAEVASRVPTSTNETALLVAVATLVAAIQR
jgi:hypothetical protein